jgi:hypothetical protein
MVPRGQHQREQRNYGNPDYNPQQNCAIAGSAMTYKPRVRDSVFACRWGLTNECVAAIDKIVAATKKQPDDSAALAKDLDGAHVMFVHLDQHTQPRQPRTGANSLKNIRKDAEKLTAAINSNSLVKEALKEFDFDKLCGVLRHLEAANKGRHPSLTEYLAGELLPAIYERRFRAKPTVTRDGPFIKFAGAALAALNVSCSPETIVKGLTRFRRA